MKESMLNLKDAIKGIALMSNDLEKMYNGLLINQVPPNWTKLSFLSLKPLGSWFDDLVSRVDYLRIWLTNEFPIAHRIAV